MLKAHPQLFRFYVLAYRPALDTRAAFESLPYTAVLVGQLSGGITVHYAIASSVIVLGD